jgi:hypothetical protein
MEAFIAAVKRHGAYRSSGAEAGSH